MAAGNPYGDLVPVNPSNVEKAAADTADSTNKEAEVFNKKQSEVIDRLHQSVLNTKGSLTKMESDFASIPLPKMEQVPQPKVQQSTPQEQWGSAAMMFAMIGSLFTRTPMTTALNAAAGVLTAYHKGDQEAANQAYKTWEVANNNALKAADYQQKTYDNILQAFRAREGATIAAGSQEERAISAELLANATAFKDTVMMQFAADRDLQGAAKHAEFLAKQKEKMDANTMKLAETQAQNEEYAKAVQEHPEWGPQQKLQKALEIKQQSSTATASRDAKEQEKEQASNIRLASINNAIDQAIAMAGAGGVSGVSGVINKALEIPKGMMGVDTGGSPAHQFENLVSVIRTGAEAELSTPGSKSNIQFRQAISNLAPYIAVGQSPETHVNALKHLSNFINEMNGKPAKYPDVETLPGVPASLSEVNATEDGGAKKGPASGPGSQTEPIKLTAPNAEEAKKAWARAEKGKWYADPTGALMYKE
jgi:hypothetical protein